MQRQNPHHFLFILLNLIQIDHISLNLISLFLKLLDPFSLLLMLHATLAKVTIDNRRLILRHHPNVGILNYIPALLSLDITITRPLWLLLLINKSILRRIPISLLSKDFLLNIIEPFLQPFVPILNLLRLSLIQLDPLLTYYLTPLFTFMRNRETCRKRTKLQEPRPQQVPKPSSSL